MAILDTLSKIKRFGLIGPVIETLGTSEASKDPEVTGT